MKFNVEILEREKEYLNEIDRARNELSEVARKASSAARGIVADMNAMWSEYIGKRVKITTIDSNSKKRDERTFVCYFDGFTVEAKFGYPTTPVIKPLLFNIKKDGGKSKTKFHFPYYTKEIVEIEVAE